VAVLYAASKHGGTVPPAAELAFLLRMTDQRAASLVAELLRAGLLDKVDGGFAPHNWAGRQYKSDGSTERVKLLQREGQATKRFRQRSAKRFIRRFRNRTRAEQNRSRAEQTRRVLIRLIWWKRRFALICGTSSVAMWTCRASRIGSARVTIPAWSGRWCVIYGVASPTASLAYFDAALADRHAKRAETRSERAGYAAVTDFDKVIAMFVRTGV
jgi:hypothetical protein